MKNHIDMLIFHTAICAGALQIALMADEKPLSRISRRPVAEFSYLHYVISIQIPMSLISEFGTLL